MKVRMIVASLFIMMTLSACGGKEDIPEADSSIPESENVYTEETDKIAETGSEAMTYRTEEETGDGKGDEESVMTMKIGESPVQVDWEDNESVSLPYYRYVMPYGLKKFKRFAEEVWNISSNGLSDEQVANEGLKAMENWMKKIGVAMNISELGATEDMIDGITEGTLILEGGYKVLTKDEIRQILKKSL